MKMTSMFWLHAGDDLRDEADIGNLTLRQILLFDVQMSKTEYTALQHHHQ
jgi:hypothetical protein